LRFLPLLALFAVPAAHAAIIGYDFGKTVQTQVTMNGSGCDLFLFCAATLSDSLQPGGASLYTPLGATGIDDRFGRTFRDGPVTDTLQLTWSGTGSGTIPGLLPLDWDFFVIGGGGTTDLQWQISLTLDGTVIYTNGFNSLNTALVAGSTYVDTASLTGQKLTSWSLTLSVSFLADGTGSGIYVDVPRGHTFDLGTSATVTPEPASLCLAGAGLLLAGLARQGFRRRMRPHSEPRAN